MEDGILGEFLGINSVSLRVTIPIWRWMKLAMWLDRMGGRVPVNSKL